MDITEIRIKRIETEGRMRALVSVTFDSEFTVHDIKIIEGSEKLFLAMPSRKLPDGGFSDIAHPINAQMRDRLERAVLDKYLTESEE